MLAYLSLLNLFYDLRFLSLSYRENVLRIEIMIFLACETKAVVFSAKKTSGSRKYLASYDIVGKASSKIGNGKWRNGEWGTGNGERGMENGERAISKRGNL